MTLMAQFLFAMCALLIFLLPVGFYCLILAGINRRGKPLLVSGVWDAIGLLFAVSGFFLATLPMLVAEFWARTYAGDDGDGFLGIYVSQWVLWLAYLMFVLSGGALMVVWRSHKTMIYNVDAELFPKALELTIANVGLSMQTQKDRLILVPNELPADPTAITQTPMKPQDKRHAELEIESFPSMCHVTLHWEACTPDVRRQIETELDRNLETATPLENPAAGWFLNVSGMIFGTLVMVVLAFVILVAIIHR